jgi:hypothetical protein
MAGFCLAAASALCDQAGLSGAAYQPGTPFTCLFDTGAASPAALSGRTLDAKTNWTLVPEDNLGHRFQGDAVLLNDKLTVVLRRQGPGAEVYSQTATGPAARAVLIPLPAAGSQITGLASVRTVENNPGAVTLAATFTTTTLRAVPGGGYPSAKLRLTTGRSMVEIRPGEAADRLAVWDRPRWVVVPSFFGNDMVFGPETFGCLRHGLPAENFFLNLLADGDAMVMCVWKSSRRWADVLLFERDGRRALGGCEIECASDEPIWIAFMEGPGIWRHQAISLSSEEKGPVIVPWQQPFEANWRADLLQRGGLAAAFGLEGQLHPDDSAVRQIRSKAEAMASSGVAPSVLTYPIDRTKATPLTAFCPIDVLRDTLGVGPCQYILQTEGLASEGNPTPAKVMDWIEKQFERGKEQQAAAEIRDLLGQMTEHVGRAQKRIRRYREFGHEIVLVCTAAGEDKDPPQNPDSLSFTAGLVEGHGQPLPLADQDPAALGQEIVALIGKENPLGECQKLGARLREIGAAQDQALSDCRMAVRWLRQQARQRVLADTGQAKLAREVLARAERMLQNQ